MGRGTIERRFDGGGASYANEGNCQINEGVSPVAAADVAA
jgi:hypothetical protein